MNAGAGPSGEDIKVIAPNEKSESEIKSGGWTLPGYKYLGPGNTLNLGEPTNPLDAIAKIHDEQYEALEKEYNKREKENYFKTEKELKNWAKQEIQQIDKQFIKDVELYVPSGLYDSIAKQLAIGGIGIKYLGEKLLGPLYPRLGNRTEGDGASAIMDDNIPTMKLPAIIGTGISNNIQTHNFSFKKMFNFHIESKLCQYHKTKPSNEAANGVIRIKTFIHTLPWHKLFMYLTPKEYNDIIQITHTAKVKHVAMKIYNLGNRTPFVASSGSVQYANANSQTTIGIWEDMGKHGMIKLGENITPQILYGSTLHDLADQNQMRQIPGEKNSAACQGKFIDNRAEYWFHNGIYDLQTNQFKPESIEKYSFLPALIASAKTFYNATNSIGLIFSKSYEPKDGTFYLRNDAWRMINYDYMKNKNPLHNVVLRDGTQTAVEHTAAKALAYENATVDNYLYNNWTTEPELHFIPNVGIGILPLLSSDGNHEKSILNIMVELSIEIEAMSHGQNILYSSVRNPQPNPLVMGYRVKDHKFSEIVIGHQPITSLTENAHSHEPEHSSVNIEIAGRSSTARSSEEIIQRQMQPVLQIDPTKETTVSTPKFFPAQGLTSNQEKTLNDIKTTLQALQKDEISRQNVEKMQQELHTLNENYKDVIQKISSNLTPSTAAQTAPTRPAPQPAATQPKPQPKPGPEPKRPRY